MSYHQDRKICAQRLQAWVANNDRPPWSSLSRSISTDLGFSEVTMRKLLADGYPGLKIEDDKLVRAD